MEKKGKRKTRQESTRFREEGGKQKSRVFENVSTTMRVCTSRKNRTEDSKEGSWRWMYHDFQMRTASDPT